jgi:monooxygenase
VIGSGATAVTLVPSMAEKAGHVTMLQRSPTYVVSVPGTSPLAPVLKKVLPDKVAGGIIRWILAMGTQGSYFLSQWKPNVVRSAIRRMQQRQLPKGFDMKHFTPSYDPWDQRLCAVPDGDLFKAIRKGTVDVVTDHIDRFTEKGILLESGEELEADVVVTATGLELLFIGGIDVTVDGEAIDIPEKLVYKGMMLEGVPNAALAIGYTNASWTLKCDLTCDYVTRMLNHMRATGTRQVTPVNADAAVSPAPLLGLSSGYITRAADRFPKQGSRFPWQVKQSYLADYRALKLKPVVDDVLVYDNPAPAGSKEEVRV